MRRLLSRYLPTADNRYRWIRKIAVLTRAAICLKPLSFQRRNLQTYRYDIVFLHFPGCINMIPTCQTLITLITESFISSPKLTLALAALNFHPPLQSQRRGLRRGPRTGSGNQSRPRSPTRRIIQWQISGKLQYLSTNLLSIQISRIL